MTAVIIDASSLSRVGADRGLGRYATALLRGAGDTPAVTVLSPDPLHRARLRHRALRSLDASRQAVLHATTPLHLPIVKDRPWVCSIQDVIPLDVRAYQNFGVRTRLLFLNARRANQIVANSNYTAARVRAQLGISADRIQTLPLPVDDVFYAASMKSEEREARSVVVMADYRTFDPRKRLHWISDIAPVVRSLGLRLVVVGRGLPTASDSSIRWVENPSDLELASIYGDALATFYPSAYEGQGLPPIEAMAAGCPVIAFDNSSVSEMVAVDDFLLPDPAPWQEQQFTSSMPARTRDAIRERLASWETDARAVESASDQARQAAERFRYEHFVSGLEVLYGKFEHDDRTE